MLRFCKKTNISNSEKEKKRTDNQDCSDKNEELGQKKMLEVKVKIEEKAEKDHAWRGWKIQSESLERDWVAGGSRGIHEIKPRSAEREREEESHFRARGDEPFFFRNGPLNTPNTTRHGRNFILLAVLSLKIINTFNFIKLLL